MEIFYRYQWQSGLTSNLSDEEDAGKSTVIMPQLRIQQREVSLEKWT